MTLLPTRFIRIHSELEKMQNSTKVFSGVDEINPQKFVQHISEVRKRCTE